MSQNDQQLMNSLVRIQCAYWLPDPEEKAKLLSRFPHDLSWAETFRLHHLACLDLLNTPEGRTQWLGDGSQSGGHGAPEGEAHALCQRLARRLMEKESPYRPRTCAVWMGGPGAAPDNATPDAMAIVRNASLTHLGSLEVIDILDDQGTPGRVTFIAFDEIQSVFMGRPSAYRAAKVRYDDGRPDAMVWLPLLYGISWATPNEFDRNGSMTRMCCFVNVEIGGPDIGIAIGHQDLQMIDPDANTGALTGIGSVRQISTALEADDPKLEQKCRVRGIDPAQVRRGG